MTAQESSPARLMPSAAPAETRQRAGTGRIRGWFDNVAFVIAKNRRRLIFVLALAGLGVALAGASTLLAQVP